MLAFRYTTPTSNVEKQRNYQRSKTMDWNSLYCRLVCVAISSNQNKYTMRPSYRTLLSLTPCPAENSIHAINAITAINAINETRVPRNRGSKKTTIRTIP
nr:MAG: hypothetical protein AmFV_00168 [Apis mellifera filamentous virus]WOK43283.1 MAG: hypothetical protein [Apis mellifera filamentous virus]WOK43590.1 MAG: hypothetical protein [Apis mellifera filamentous virus]